MQPAAPRRVKLTYDDYANFPDDGQQHELIDGEHFVTPAPKRSHQQISSLLHVALAVYVRDHRVGGVYPAPLDVILSQHDVVQPDIIYVSKERSNILGEWIHGAPDLVVEILSPTTRAKDMNAKRGLYDRFGVREYWIVDPEHETVLVYRRGDDGSFPQIAELARAKDQSIATPLLPGFALRLRELFE